MTSPDDDDETVSVDDGEQEQVSIDIERADLIWPQRAFDGLWTASWQKTQRIRRFEHPLQPSLGVAGASRSTPM